MRTQLELRSDLFPAYEGEEAEINPGRWGKRLAEFLQQKLSDQGIRTGEIYSEDWGWAVPIEHDAFPIWLGCGNVDDSPGEFLVFIEPSKPTIRKGLFGKIDTTADVERVATALDRILTSDAGISRISWVDGP
jgi:hypothetical protein